MNSKNTLGFCSIAITAAMLAACGESDLKEQHDSELEAARIALSDQPSLGSATAGLSLEQFSLVFQEEFLGSEINAERWNTALPWGADFIINDEVQYYVDTQGNPDFGYDPFVLDGESLTITASPTPDAYADRANSQSWLSGALSTHEKFDFTHGYIEARVDLPQGQGLWPAFWMLGSENVLRKPQLFIMEYNGSSTDSVFLNYNFENDAGQLATFGQREYTVNGFGEGFHIVGVEWSPEAMRFFVDGTLLRSIPAGTLPEQDMYMILNLAVGGSFVGAPDSSTPAEAAYKIDYVRVYQKTQ